MLHRAKLVRLLTSQSRRMLSTPRDIRQQPQLNQFQNPNRPPEQFQNDGQPGNIGGNQRPPQGSPANPIIGRKQTINHMPPSSQPPMNNNMPTGSRRNPEFGIGGFVVGLVSLAMIVIGSTGLYTSYKAENISDEGIDLLNDAMKYEKAKNIDRAIESYVEFLKKLDSEGVSHTSPNYLGASVRIAELYELKKMPDKAYRIYDSLAHYLTEQVSNWEPQSWITSSEEFDALMTRSLTIVTKYADMAPEDEVDEAKKLLLMNIVQAQRRIIERYPPFISVLNQNTNQNILALLAKDMADKMSGKSEEQKKQQLKKALKTPLELPIYTTDPTEENRLLGLFVKGWPVFTRCLINARDLYANICIDDGDYSEAAACLTTNALIIQRCFDHPARLSICLTKLAIVLQMMAEMLSDKAGEEKEEPGKDTETLNIEDLTKLSPDKLMGGAFQNNPQVKEFVIEKTYKESERIFTRTVMLTQKMQNQPATRGEFGKFYGAALKRSEMVSSCGLALINYQSGDSREAQKYLRRARSLAVSLNSKPYIEDIGKWMSQIGEESNE